MVNEQERAIRCSDCSCMYWVTLNAFRLNSLLQEGFIVLGFGTAMIVAKIVLKRCGYDSET